MESNKAEPINVFKYAHTVQWNSFRNSCSNIIKFFIVSGFIKHSCALCATQNANMIRFNWNSMYETAQFVLRESTDVHTQHAFYYKFWLGFVEIISKPAQTIISNNFIEVLVKQYLHRCQNKYENSIERNQRIKLAYVHRGRQRERVIWFCNEYSVISYNFRAIWYRFEQAMFFRVSTEHKMIRIWAWTRARFVISISDFVIVFYETVIVGHAYIKHALFHTCAFKFVFSQASKAKQ